MQPIVKNFLCRGYPKAFSPWCRLSYPGVFHNNPHFRVEFFAPDYPGEVVIMIMINLLTILTGLRIQFIMFLNNLAFLSPSAPFLGLLLIAVEKALSQLDRRAQGAGFTRGSQVKRLGYRKILGYRTQKDESSL